MVALDNTELCINIAYNTIDGITKFNKYSAQFRSLSAPAVGDTLDTNYLSCTKTHMLLSVFRGRKLVLALIILVSLIISLIFILLITTRKVWNFQYIVCSQTVKSI